MLVKDARERVLVRDEEEPVRLKHLFDIRAHRRILVQ